jgi:hypothetical protein
VIPTRVLTIAICLAAGSFSPVSSATKKVRVPNQYDGTWSIVASTADGPCAATKTYQVRIKDSDASVPGEDMEVDGGVSAAGAVQATIVQGSNRVPITGTLSVKGSGTGTWRTSGGLVECSGSWSAKRAG